MEGLRDIFGEPAYHIAERHWQSGFPRPFFDLCKYDVDVLVMASAEVQPDATARQQIEARCPNLTVICCPFGDFDDAMYLSTVSPRLDKVADLICRCLSAGKRVLVTCSAGRNRSGLISGLVLRKRYGMSGADAVAQIKAVRSNALTNDVFRRYLEALP